MTSRYSCGVQAFFASVTRAYVTHCEIHVCPIFMGVVTHVTDGKAESGMLSKQDVLERALLNR